MTKVTFYKTNGIYYGFHEQGHSELEDRGNDVLCAAISAMTMLIVNSVEACYDSRVDYTIDEETTDVTVICKSALPKFEPDVKKQFAVSGLIQAYFYQLMDLVEDYYEYLDVNEIEREI